MKLQSGTTQALFNIQRTNPLYNKPVLQITSLSKFTFGAEEKNRYKANLSDGTNYLKSIFSSDISKKFDDEEIKLYSIIKLGTFSIRPKDNNIYVYVQSIEEYEQTDNIIGHPVNISSGKQSLDPSLTKPEDVRSLKQEDKPKKSESIQTPNVQSSKNDLVYNRQNTEQESNKRVKTTDEGITEIKRIFPQKKDFTFKGRIVSKSEIKRFNTQKGEGKLFSFEVADASGQIKCVAFSETVDIFFPLVEVGQVYSISNTTVKPANKKFSNTTSDFEIQLESSSEIRKVDDNGIPKYSFKFIKIADFSTVGGIVDCLGVIKEVYPFAKIIIKATGKETSKRDIQIIDQTGNIRLTIWGQKAEEEYEKDSVICVKSAKIGDYNGVSLSTIASSIIIPNIDLPESVELLAWYEEEGRNVLIEKPKKVPRRSLINDVKENGLEYATIQGSVMFIKTENLYYESCPSENCNKKVSMEDNGVYRCEKCNYTFENCNYRYMINLHVGDFTGQHWITLFDDHGKVLLGLTAQELKELSSSNPEEAHSLIKGVLAKDYQFKIKNKEENYNGESKLRSNCLEIGVVDYSQETKKMLEMIEKINV